MNLPEGPDSLPEGPIIKEMIVSNPVVAARRRHAIFLGVCAALALGLIYAASSVMLPFVLAIVIAYVLTPAVAWVESKRVPRAGAIVLVYIVFLGAIGGFVRVTAPRVVVELAGLRREIPALSHAIRREWVPAAQQRLRDVGLGGPNPGAESPRDPRDRDGDGKEDPPALVARERADGSYAIELDGPLAITQTHGGYVIEPMGDQKAEPFDLDKVVADAAGKSMAYAQNNAMELFRIGRNIIAGVSRAIFVFGLTLMLGAYMILTRERIAAFFTALLRPSQRLSGQQLFARIDRGLSGVVRGQLIICCVNGVLSAIGFGFVGLKYWPVLAILCLVFSLVPIFGSVMSAVPAVILGLTQSFGTAMFVLVWIVGIHQLEANVLNPKILGDSAKIHPVLVVFSLLVGEHFFGVVGALLAVPMMSITQNVFIHIRARIQAMDPEMAMEPVASLIPGPPPAVARAVTPR